MCTGNYNHLSNGPGGLGPPYHHHHLSMQLHNGVLGATSTLPAVEGDGHETPEDHTPASDLTPTHQSGVGEGTSEAAAAVAESELPAMVPPPIVRY